MENKIELDDFSFPIFLPCVDAETQANLYELSNLNWDWSYCVQNGFSVPCLIISTNSLGCVPATLNPKKSYSNGKLIERSNNSQIFRLQPYNINVMPYPLVPIYVPPMVGVLPQVPPQPISSPNRSLNTSTENSNEEFQGGGDAAVQK